MIQLFQEAIPFSNKRIESPVSQDGSFINPVIMPFAINTTLGTNVFETIFYIRNTSIKNYYTDVVVSLMKENSNIPSGEIATGVISYDSVTKAANFSLNNYTNIPASLAFPYSGTVTGTKVLDGKYGQNYVPVTPDTDSVISAKFSYGYDEVSALEWEGLSNVLIIPTIGTGTTPDTSYIPVRMRLSFKETPSKFTIRDYFIDISYAYEGDIQ